MKAVCWVTELVFSSHSQFYIKVVLWTSFIPNLKQHEHKENQPQHLQMQTSSLVLNDLICETTREQIYPEQSCLKPVFPFFFPPLRSALLSQKQWHQWPPYRNTGAGREWVSAESLQDTAQGRGEQSAAPVLL